ncbi:MAG: CpsB/CapC family capsule biosynthesis tyrosine phosphatase [Bryobacteraceae bacterium]|jgi:protein-tyrosine phosphatase
MIDIHSHVLAGLDDGARSFEESVAMIRLAAETGTTDLVASPHANMDFRFDPERVEERLSELRQVSGAPRLHCGCDFHLYFDNIHDALAHPSKYTINHKRYLLVEFPDLLIAKSTPEVFAQLLNSGMTPVITHPERNFLLHKRMEEMESWIESGCLVQVTAQSLLGRFGADARNVARQLMKRGLVHFIASDAHDAEDRTPRLDLAYKHVAGRYGRERAELLFVTNPLAVIEGEPLPEQPAPEADTGRKWFKFWG